MIACIGCKHYDGSWGDRCGHPQVVRKNPVYGFEQEGCYVARDTNGKCGPEAKFFEAKPTTPKRKWWFF